MNKKIIIVSLLKLKHYFVIIVKWDTGNDHNLNMISHIQTNCVNFQDIS